MKYFLAFVLIIVFTHSAPGQDLAQDGYIVLTNGDTLTGKVQRIKETFTGVKFLNKLRFWNESGKRKKYALSRILEFKIGNEVYRKYRIELVPGINIFNAHYQIVAYGGEEKFLRVLKEGPLCMYEYEWIDSMDDTISSFPLFRRTDEKILVRATQGVFGLKKKVLISYFSDCPDLQLKIENKDFKLPIDIVNYYNSQCKPTY